MARNARLALLQNLCEFADRKVDCAQQDEDAQPRRIGKGAQKIEQASHDETDIKISLYVVNGNGLSHL